jgi:preprotein translocase subunit SecB
MKRKVFSDDLTIHSQVIKSVVYFDLPDKDFDISECDLSFNVLRHKENKRDFKVQLFLQLEMFKIIVEGHYEVSSNIENEQLNKIIEIAGLTTLIPFLRHSILNVTSSTKEGGIHLPLINLNNLIKNQMEMNKSKSKKKPAKKTTVRAKPSKKTSKKAE